MIKKISLAALAVVALLVKDSRAWIYGQDPGMLMRIENKTIEKLKRAAHNFLPYLFTYDFLLPKSHLFEYKTFIPGLEWEI